MDFLRRDGISKIRISVAAGRRREWLSEWMRFRGDRGNVAASRGDRGRIARSIGDRRDVVAVTRGGDGGIVAPSSDYRRRGSARMLAFHLLVVSAFVFFLSQISFRFIKCMI